MTRHVLLLNSDKPEALGALARRTDVRVRVLTRKRYTAFHEGLPTATVESFEDLTQVGRAAYELAGSDRIDRVIAATEKSIVAAALVRSLLGVPGLSLDQALWTSHKRSMKQRLRAAGLPTSAFSQVAAVVDVPVAAGAIGWPVVVKPVLGSGSRDTHRLSSPEDFNGKLRSGALDGLSARGVPILVEAQVRVRDEYHCDGVVQEGEIVSAAVSRYFIPPLDVSGNLHGSHLVDPGSTVSQDILELHRKVVRALRLSDCVTHLEVFGTPGGHVIGEVTTRPAGLGVPRMWERAFGLDLWEGFLRAELGEGRGHGRTHPEQVFAWAHLPDSPGLVETVSAVPGVFEVLSPASNGTPNVEVHFTASGEGAAETIHDTLHSLAAPGGP